MSCLGVVEQHEAQTPLGFTMIKLEKTTKRMSELTVKNVHWVGIQLLKKLFMHTNYPKKLTLKMLLTSGKIELILVSTRLY